MAVDSVPDIIIRAGIPGLGHEHLADGTGGYPSTTQDVAKLLAAYDLIVVFDRPRQERTDLLYHAIDTWIPVLEVVKDLGVGVLGGCIVELVKSPRTRVNMKVGRRRGDKVEWLDVSGDRDDVIETVEAFLEQGADDE